MKRLLTIILSLCICITCAIPTYAAQVENTNHPLSDNLLFRYLQGDDNNRLLRRDNYLYMSFVEKFQSNPFALGTAKVADLYAGIGTEPNEDECIETLITLYALYEQENAADMSAQKKLDHQKTGANYAAEIAATAADTASAWFGASMPTNEMVDMLTKVLGGLSTAAKNIDVVIDALSDLEVLVQNYADYDTFLAMIEGNADGALKTAASTLRSKMQEMMDLRLTTYDDAAQKSSENLQEYLVSDWFIDICQNIPEYQNDAQMQKILGTYSDYFNLKQAWDAGSAIGMLTADAVVGGEKLINRLHEMMALHEISVILQTELLSLNSDFLDKYPSDESDQFAEQFISFSKYLISARLRGEYCLYSVVTSDDGLLYWFGKANREEAAKWYERQNERISEIKDAIGVMNTPTNYENLVTDAYSYARLYNDGYTNANITYEIPHINLPGTAIKEINSEIYDTFYYGTVEDELSNMSAGVSVIEYEITYDWAVNGDILSLLITRNDTWGDTDYRVYNVSVSTGDKMSISELVSIAGLSQAEYFDTVRQALGSAYFQGTEWYADQAGYNSFFRTQLGKTLSEENIQNCAPYFNRNGQLCIIGAVYSLVEADYYYHEINLENYVVNPAFNKYVDVQTDAANSNSFAERYKAILLQHPESTPFTYGSKTIYIDTEYMVYDIDKNGTPELIVKEDTSDYYFYSFNGTDVVSSDVCYWSYNDCLYAYQGNGIVVHDGGMGSMRIENATLYSMVNNMLVWTKELMSTEECSLNELYSFLDSLTPINDFHPITDYSYLSN